MDDAPKAPDLTTLEGLRRRLVGQPFNTWLGLKLLAAGAEGVEMLVPWRAEFMGNPDMQRMHGGVAASLIDVTCAFAVMARSGLQIATTDLRVDYHQVAGVGDLRTYGSVVHLGGRIACAEAKIIDKDDQLIASGRGTFYLLRK